MQKKKQAFVPSRTINNWSLYIGQCSNLIWMIFYRIRISTTFFWYLMLRAMTDWPPHQDDAMDSIAFPRTNYLLWITGGMHHRRWAVFSGSDGMIWLRPTLRTIITKFLWPQSNGIDFEDKRVESSVTLPHIMFFNFNFFSALYRY